MKKFTILVITAMVILVLAGCGNKNTPEAVVGDFLDTFDTYISDMGNADNVDSAIVAMEKFTKAMESIKPRMKKIEEKYPDLKNSFKGGALPAGLKKYEERVKEMGPKMAGLMGKMMQFMSDPKFQEASKKMNEAMK